MFENLRRPIFKWVVVIWQKPVKPIKNFFWNATDKFQGLVITGGEKNEPIL